MNAGASLANISKYKAKKKLQSIAVAKISIINLLARFSDIIKTSYNFCRQHFDKKNIIQYWKDYKGKMYKTKIMDKQH